jgi:nucleoid DNA-binding protein
MNKLMSKSELIQEIAEEHSGKLTRNDVKGVLASLTNVGYREIKRTGAFVVPGFAKFVVIKKPATKAHKGINPFTKEPITSRRSRLENHRGTPGKGRQRRRGINLQHRGFAGIIACSRKHKSSLRRLDRRR